MALTALASVSDMTARGMSIAADENTVVGVHLDVVSTAVREAAGTPISETDSVVTLEGATGQWLTLPGLPVTAVSSVLLDDVTVTDWRLRSSRLWRACGWQSGCGPSEVTVSQTHGLPTVPADIVDLVCRITAAVLVSWRAEDDGTALAASDIRSERIGDYSVTYGGNGLISEVELPDYERERLAARFGGGMSLSTSR